MTRISQKKVIYQKLKKITFEEYWEIWSSHREIMMWKFGNSQKQLLLDLWEDMRRSTSEIWNFTKQFYKDRYFVKRAC